MNATRRPSGEMRGAQATLDPPMRRLPDHVTVFAGRIFRVARLSIATIATAKPNTTAARFQEFDGALSFETGSAISIRTSAMSCIRVRASFARQRDNTPNGGRDFGGQFRPIGFLVDD